jgi:nucleoside triphosphate diphosphatase
MLGRGRDPRHVLDKIREELDEIEAALDGGEPARIVEETGDLLFAVANLARHLEVDPEGALRMANEKFRRRFRHVEQRAEESGADLAAAGLERMEGWWREAKSAE